MTIHMLKTRIPKLFPASPPQSFDIWFIVHLHHLLPSQAHPSLRFSRHTLSFWASPGSVQQHHPYVLSKYPSPSTNIIPKYPSPPTNITPVSSPNPSWSSPSFILPELPDCIWASAPASTLVEPRNFKQKDYLFPDIAQPCIAQGSVLAVPGDEHIPSHFPLFPISQLGIPKLPNFLIHPKGSQGDLA